MWTRLSNKKILPSNTPTWEQSSLFPHTTILKGFGKKKHVFTLHRLSFRLTEHLSKTQNGSWEDRSSSATLNSLEDYPPISPNLHSLGEGLVWDRVVWTSATRGAEGGKWDLISVWFSKSAQWKCFCLKEKREKKKTERNKKIKDLLGFHQITM